MVSRGSSSSLTESGAAVAMELNTLFRFVNTKLAYVYGGGESGLAYFLKNCRSADQAQPAGRPHRLEQEFIDQSLASAWQSCRQKYGDDPSAWQERARAAVIRQHLGFYESLDRYPALDNAQAVCRSPACRNRRRNGGLPVCAIVYAVGPNA